MALGVILLISSVTPFGPQANSQESKPISQEAVIKLITQDLQPPKTPGFPNTDSNYQNTIVIPAQKAAEAAAEAQAQQLAAEQAQTVQTASTQAVVPTGGTCGDWIAAAGISDIGDALAVINMESGCNPNAVNPSSGACGIGQALPCSKMPCSLGDGACQVRWMAGYVAGTYGSWAAALGHEHAFGWY